MYLVIIGARSTGTSLYLVSLARRYGYRVIVLTAHYDNLDNVFEADVEVVSMDISVDSVAAWIDTSLVAPGETHMRY